MKTGLQETISQILKDHRGILAADETPNNLQSKFDRLNMPCTPDTRRDYREMLFTTEGMEKYIGGVILQDETIRQMMRDGSAALTKPLKDHHIVLGIKVDMGTAPFPGNDQEKITHGLEGLDDRLKEYYALGARFAKWRAVITIGNGIPSDECIESNCAILAQYAKACQENGIVPIVEPEVLAEGDHTLERCQEVTEKTLKQLFHELKNLGISLEGVLLKPNMVIQGLHCPEKAAPEVVAQKTVDTLKKCVPSGVGGIVFLSGGQTEEEATQYLNDMIKQNPDLPWVLSFSYGRALQASSMKTWQGQLSNVPHAQKEFLKRAELNSRAAAGKL